MDIMVKYKAGRPIPEPYQHRDTAAAEVPDMGGLKITLDDGTIVWLLGAREEFLRAAEQMKD